MLAHGAESGDHPAKFFSPENRDQFLDGVLTTLRTDRRIAAVLVVGSGAEGFLDVYSDIDLWIVATRESHLPAIYREWGERFGEVFPLFHAVELAQSRVWLFLLEDFLEVDMRFLSLERLAPPTGCWKVVFDRTGRVASTLRARIESRPQPDRPEAYLERLDSIWHYIIRAASDVRRGNPWKALCALETIRSRTIELRGLRDSVETHRFQDVDQMAPQFLSSLELTLVARLELHEILRATRQATTCFFREARALDQELGLDRARAMERKMLEYLNLFE